MEKKKIFFFLDTNKKAKKYEQFYLYKQSY
jgi:hypothetical protein